jgi:hypothetical protein
MASRQVSCKGCTKRVSSTGSTEHVRLLSRSKDYLITGPDECASRTVGYNHVHGAQLRQSTQNPGNTHFITTRGKPPRS